MTRTAPWLKLIPLFAALAISGIAMVASSHAAPAKHAEPWQCPPGWECRPILPAVPVVPVTLHAPVTITITEGDVSLTDGAALTVSENGGFNISGGTIVIKSTAAYVAPETEPLDMRSGPNGTVDADPNPSAPPPHCN